ncbi:hypothetical protein SO802_006101 [Lithocarpus litseifolius]|uniref:Uncharacterized protein n=1 Tax=Lithocarpus litseifolius TaxID=425828 RepID=A0AAW2DMX6_9ROSI
MNQLKKHILFFDFLENYYVSKDKVSQNHLNVIKKSNFVKEDKTVIMSSHPPHETVLINCKGTDVKASPFKIADADTPVFSIIEQNNFTNESLHVIGQQLDRIEEKIADKTVLPKSEVVEKSAVSKPEKPLIDLPSQKGKLNFKTSQAKTLEIVEKMLSDLKVKTEEESRDSIKSVAKKNDEGLPIFDENIGRGILDDVSTLIYTILKHFVESYSGKIATSLIGKKSLLTVCLLSLLIRQKGKKHDKGYKNYNHKKHKRYKTNFVKPNDFFAKRKNVSKKYDKQKSGKATIPDPDDLDDGDNVFIQLDWKEHFGSSLRVYEKKHPFPSLLINYEDGEDEEDRDPDWLSQMFEYGFIRDPYALAECWRSYFNNQILEVTQDLWKDYHFIGSTDRISVFGRRPYDIAIRNLRRIGHTDPREFLTGENPKYEPILYYGLCNQYATYHEHGCNDDSPWDPYDGYPSDAPDTNK